MSRPGYDSVVLITGFPSFVAKRMLQHLLASEPRTLVYAVVLAKSWAQASTERDALPAPDRERVVLLEGDVTAMDLGLSGAEFRQLTREVDRIHHLAYMGHAGADRSAAHALNVVGTAEVLELARACASLQCLVHQSTAFVSGDRTGTVYEDDLEAGQTFRNPVEETRMRAEVLVRRAMRHVPVAVIRPTTVVGDSVSGEIDRLDGLYLLVLLIMAAPPDIAIPMPGRGDVPLNIVPIDFVVRAAHAIGLHRLAPRRTFHIADPHPLSARRVFDLVAKASGRRAARGHIPSNLAKALLRTPGIERFLRSPRAFVEQLTTPVRYDARNADLVLAGAGITCPPFESYVDVLVGAVQDRVRERRERPEPEAGADADLDIEDPLS
ncbi:SDR family oxidoreductase [Sorangium sp. So ce1036]|uniref:SDR family oxidoreductase n=1 Tax=Sorangium sp. So ce1036 TaxID=3133328 RepID=UPI003F0FF148